MIVGIRRENKNVWEKRVPLIPQDVCALKEKYGMKTIVQPSKIRVYKDEDYISCGAEIDEDLTHADVIFAVKEIPPHLILENKTYVFFSHVIKGQQHNMPMLKTLMEKKCNLIDYERIVDENNKRLIFFGRYAGKSGIIETLHAFAEKLKLNGYSTPLEQLKQPYQYDSIKEAKEHVGAIGKQIKEWGLPNNLLPIVFGFVGYGNVSQGAQEIFDLLPFIEVSPIDLKRRFNELKSLSNTLIKVVFKEEHTVRKKHQVSEFSNEFDLQDYYKNPKDYESQFDQYLNYLDVIVNCIIWNIDNPRLVTYDYLKKNPNTRIKVIGDLSCDINGGIEICYRVTDPANPTYTYFPHKNIFEDGTKKDGITMMAIDNLPCEFPKEASSEFSSVLSKYVYEIYHADFNKSFEELELSYPIKRGLILHKGKLTKEYEYLTEYLNRS